MKDVQPATFAGFQTLGLELFFTRHRKMRKIQTSTTVIVLHTKSVFLKHEVEKFAKSAIF